jgi:hypothetical protein
MSAESNSETAIFERLVLPTGSGMTQETARSLIALRFGPEDTARMQELADKARQGDLTPPEQREVESYERVGHYLSILQSKARVALRGTMSSDGT